MGRASVSFVAVVVASTSLFGACLFPSLSDLQGAGGAGASTTDGGAAGGGTGGHVGGGGTGGAGGARPGCGADLDGLLANWPMTEGSGETITDCAGKYPGTFVGVVGWTTGPTGLPALAMGGGYVELVDDPALRIVGPFTIAMWISASPAQTDEFGDIVARYKQNGLFDVTVQAGPSVALTLFNGATITQTTSPIEFDTYTHVTAVYVPKAGGGTAKIYRDGVLIQSTAMAPASLAASSVKLRFGTNDNATSTYVGKLAGVRIYTRALEDSEIADLATK